MKTSDPSPSPIPSPPQRRWRRALTLLIGGLLAAILVAGSLVGLLLRSLDHPRVKRQLLALVHDLSAIDIDYDATQVRLLSGLRIQGLVVRSPVPYQDLAPELLRLDALELEWSLPRLLSILPPLRRVTLRGLRVTVVRDVDGQLSLSRLGGDAPQPAKRPTPPSRLLGSLLAQTPPLQELRVEQVALVLLQRGTAGLAQRVTLGGLRAELSAERSAGRWQVRIQAGTPSAPLNLLAQREGRSAPLGPPAPRSLPPPLQPAGEVLAQLALDLRASAAALDVDLDLHLLRETLTPLLAPQLPAGSDAAPRRRHLVRLRAQARFDSRAGRTQLTLKDTALADGALTLAASADLSDIPSGPHLLRSAQGTLDLVRLLKQLPAGLLPLPLSATQGSLRLDAAQVLLAPALRLNPGGHALIDGQVAALRAALPGGGGALLLPRGQVSLQIEPTPPRPGAPRSDRALSLRLKLPLRGLRLERRDAILSVAALDLSASGRADAEGALSGDGALRVQGLSRLRPRQAPAASPQTAQAEPAAEAGLHGLTLREGQLNLHAPTLTLLREPGQQRVARGALLLTGQLGGLTFSQPGLRASAESIALNGQGRLPGPPFNLDLTLPVTSLLVTRGSAAAAPAPPSAAAPSAPPAASGAPRPHGAVLLSGPLRLELHLQDVYPDRLAPRRSRGDLAVTLEHGGLQAQLKAQKRTSDGLDYTLSADAPSLALLRGFLGGALAQIPWDRVGLSLRSKGKLERLGDPHRALSQRTELTLERLTLPHRGEKHPPWAQAQSLSLVATSSGGARQHQLDADLRVHGLAVDGNALDDARLQLGLAATAEPPALRLHLDSSAGDKGPLLALKFATGYERGARALTYDLSASASRLASLQPLLAKARGASGFDLKDLALTLGGRGAVTGVVESLGADLTPRLAPRPLATLAVDGTLDLGAKGLYFSNGLQVVKTPGFSLHGVLSAAGDKRLLRGDLRLSELHIEVGDKNIDLAGVSDTLDLTMQGDLALGQGELTQRLTLKRLSQEYAPGYPIEDATLLLQATRNRDGELRIAKLRLDNPRAGSVLDLSGRMEFGEERRSISLRGTLDQQLANLWSDRAAYRGRGALSVTLRVDSGNFTLYHATAALKAKDVEVSLPRRGVAIEGFSGEVPVRLQIRKGRRGLHIQRGGAANAYTQLRYPDQHPLLQGLSFITVGRITSPWLTITGLAGNLRVEDNLVSLNQFELALRGGQMTGQCLLDYGEDDSTVQLRVRASRIGASQGERFDGNAALTYGVRGRNLSGRAEILRIGRRHLLDLLDLQDPPRTDVAANRIRGALKLGFPERVSLAFDHGFATARISFGGLAGLVRVDALRGIPLGPILDRMIPRRSSADEEEETP